VIGHWCAQINPDLPKFAQTKYADLHWKISILIPDYTISAKCGYSHISHPLVDNAVSKPAHLTANQLTSTLLAAAISMRALASWVQGAAFLMKRSAMESLHAVPTGEAARRMGAGAASPVCGRIPIQAA
jgi:hypothetical protein